MTWVGFFQSPDAIAYFKKRINDWNLAERPLAGHGTAGIMALVHGTLLKLQNLLIYYWITIVIVLIF